MRRDPSICLFGTVVAMSSEVLGRLIGCRQSKEGEALSKLLNDPRRQVIRLGTDVFQVLLAISHNLYLGSNILLLSVLLNPNCQPPALFAESSLSACMLSEQLPLREVSLARLRWLHTFEKWGFRNVL